MSRDMSHDMPHDTNNETSLRVREKGPCSDTRAEQKLLDAFQSL